MGFLNLETKCNLFIVSFITKYFVATFVTNIVLGSTMLLVLLVVKMLRTDGAYTVFSYYILFISCCLSTRVAVVDGKVCK